MENRLIHRKRRIPIHDKPSSQWAGRPQLEPILDSFDGELLRKYERFMRESNAIEGEFAPNIPNPITGTKTFIPVGSLHKNDIEAMEWWMNLKSIAEKDLLKLHGILGEGRPLEFIGRYRECDVVVGDHRPFPWGQVPVEMKAFFGQWPEMDSFESHCLYEMIHPFEDLNGRTGRLLWLWKAVRENYNYRIPFLQAFYYQTLSHMREHI